MTPATTFVGRRVALFGLGGSGFATALALQAGGAEVAAWDDSPASRDKAAVAGVPVVDLASADWSAFAALVLSPGVPLTHPAPHWTVERAHAAGIEVIGDIELFCRERAKLAPNSPFVAITGTNGKSTTTALVAHILRQAGRDVQMGGNIGTPILALEPPSADRVHVIELSSFQIDLTPSFGRAPHHPPHAEVVAAGDPRSTHDSGVSFEASLRSAPQDVGGETIPGPSVGVLLNITPDHLDRHGTMANYAAIKGRLVASAECVAISLDDEYSTAIDSILRQPTIPFSAERDPGRGAIYAAGSRLIRRPGTPKSKVLASLEGISTLRGKHNAQNAAAALAALNWFFLPEIVVQQALRTFPGLAHRMEPLGHLGRTLFVNDSKATNADSAEKALASFDGPIHWIIGGKAKEGGIDPLRPLFTKIAKAYLIGEATEAFAVTLDEAGVPYERCGALDRAVAAAAADATRSDSPEPVVLLSPACASYDQYRNFEIRGDHFRELVRALPGVEMRA